MEWEYIEAENTRFFLFCTEERCMAVHPCGGMVLLDAAIAKQIKNREFDFKRYPIFAQRLFYQHPEVEEEDCCPAFFLIDLTKQCNFRCIYCFRDLQQNSQKNLQENSQKNSQKNLQKNSQENLQHNLQQNPKQENAGICTEKVLDIADFLVRYFRKYHQPVTLQMWGGEPLLEWKHIVELDDCLREQNIRYHITMEVNGSLLTREIAEEIRKRHFSIGVSLDGTEYLHNKQRPFADGSPSFSKVMEGITYLRQEGIENFAVICVITKKNYQHIREIRQYFQEQNIRYMKFNCVHNSSFRKNGYELDEKELLEFYDTMLEIMKESCEADIPFLDNNILQRLKNLLFFDNQNYCISRGCRAGFRLLSIDRNGDIYPCELMDYPDMCLGTIYEEDLPNVISRSKEKLQQFAFHIEEQCRECPWYAYCKGGCSSNIRFYQEQDKKHQQLKIDKTLCTINQFLYPKLAELILKEPELINKWLNREVL